MWWCTLQSEGVAGKREKADGKGQSSRLTPFPGYSACRLLMVSSIEGPLADLCRWVRWVAAY